MNKVQEKDAQIPRWLQLWNELVRNETNDPVIKEVVKEGRMK